MLSVVKSATVDGAKAPRSIPATRPTTGRDPNELLAASLVGGAAATAATEQPKQAAFVLDETLARQSAEARTQLVQPLPPTAPSSDQATYDRSGQKLTPPKSSIALEA